MENIDLFCLPYAGGSKYAYREYEKLSPPFLNIIPLEYPGRGARTKEPFISDVHGLVDDLYTQIRHSLKDRRYALYGHSMGGVIAFLLARKIIDNNGPPPVHLFITGTYGPSSGKRGQKKYHLLDRDAFIEAVKKLGGLPETLLENSELMLFFEPILRSDFKANETYKYERREPLSVPFTVITGTEEDMLPEDILLWQNETKYNVDFRKMHGNHFFIFKQPNAIIHIIAVKLFSSR